MCSVGCESCIKKYGYTVLKMMCDTYTTDFKTYSTDTIVTFRLFFKKKKFTATLTSRYHNNVTKNSG